MSNTLNVPLAELTERANRMILALRRDTRYMEEYNLDKTFIDKLLQLNTQLKEELNSLSKDKTKNCSELALDVHALLKEASVIGMKIWKNKSNGLHNNYYLYGSNKPNKEAEDDIREFETLQVN